MAAHWCPCDDAERPLADRTPAKRVSDDPTWLRLGLRQRRLAAAGICLEPERAAANRKSDSADAPRIELALSFDPSRHRLGLLEWRVAPPQFATPGGQEWHRQPDSPRPIAAPGATAVFRHFRRPCRGLGPNQRRLGTTESPARRGRHLHESLRASPPEPM